MKKIILLLTLLLSSCTYLQIQNAVKLANNGDYNQSIYIVRNVLVNSPEDKQAIETLKNVYTTGKNSYLKEAELYRDIDILKETKALYQLSKLNESYFWIPDKTKTYLSELEPSEEEIKENYIKLADNLYTIGKNQKDLTYPEKLIKYSYLSNAQKFNIINSKEIEKEFLKSEKDAKGNIYFYVNGYMSGELYPLIKETINSYPLFSVVDKKQSNLELKINITDYKYIPENIRTEYGTNSYIETITRTVPKIITETYMIDGKEQKRNKVVYVDIDYDETIFYGFINYIKSAEISFYIEYILIDKNNNEIFYRKDKVKIADSVNWKNYTPTRTYIGYLHNFPKNENEKNIISEEKLFEKAYKECEKKIDNELHLLYKNATLNW